MKLYLALWHENVPDIDPDEGYATEVLAVCSTRGLAMAACDHYKRGRLADDGVAPHVKWEDYTDGEFTVEERDLDDLDWSYPQ